jgi:K+-transporting ATPase ATPase C chain
MKTQIFISIKIFALFTIVLGVAYPLFVNGIAQLAFPVKANGSLIVQGNKVIGSELIGQKFDNELYFSSRPSATDYSPMPSGGSNLGPTSSKLKQLVTDRKEQFIEFNQLSGTEIIPSEMLYSSASGLDPHISPEAALLQINRICKVRQLNEVQEKELILLINNSTELQQFGIFGEKRVNVLKLNLKLDQLK